MVYMIAVDSFIGYDHHKYALMVITLKMAFETNKKFANFIVQMADVAYWLLGSVWILGCLLWIFKYLVSPDRLKHDLLQYVQVRPLLI